MFAQRARRQTPLIKFDTAVVPTQTTLLLMSRAGVKEPSAFLIREIIEEQRSVPADQDHSPKGIESAIHQGRMFKAIRLCVAKRRARILMTQLRLQSSNAWQDVQRAGHIGTAQER